MLKSHRFNSALDLETTLHRFVRLYKEHLPQRTLDLNTLIQAFKKLQSEHPDLFVKQVANHPVPDSWDLLKEVNRSLCNNPCLRDCSSWPFLFCTVDEHVLMRPCWHC